jgi:hypothetical protein
VLVTEAGVGIAIFLVGHGKELRFQVGRKTKSYVVCIVSDGQ